MKTTEKSTSEKTKPIENRNMALAKPVSRVVPKPRKTAAPATPSNVSKKKWDPSALYF
jgi:hypothetical protein